MNGPLVSIVMPCYQNGRTLARTVRSIQAQTEQSWELIAVDDGSSDGTLELMKELHARDGRVRFLSFSRNFGKEAALLAGLSFSSADETLLYAQQVKDAVITSVGSGNRIGYLARLDGRVTLVQKEAVDMIVHGAGDVFTSALCGELLNGQAPQTALLRAADFCDSGIHETAKRQPGHWYGLAFEPVLKGTRV